MTYYDKKYFNWQKRIGIFGGKANLFKFEKFISKEDVVVDFGAGGGYLLSKIQCKEKTGIEINDVARKECVESGINCKKSIEELPENYADTIISNHVLEHVECPLEILKSLKSKLKDKGKIVFVVPHHRHKEKYDPNDINYHLYSWNMMTLGNLFKAAGYKVLKVNNIRHKWPPYFLQISKLIGLRGFNILSVIYSILKRNYQVQIIAEK